MTSKLVERLFEHEGLAPLLALRKEGGVPAGAEAADLLSRAALLALGAAADVARRQECGDEVRIYVPAPPPPGPGLLVLGASPPAGGTAFLRELATLRLTGPIGARIVVDFGAVGLEIAQVALSFGATDWAGPIARRGGLPLIDADDQRKLVKRREIAGFVERAGFRPLFVSTDAPPPVRSHVES
ncbi:MAG TPA: hypothetical protein VF881_09135 [Polyangiaceae bacterium]